MTLDVGSVILPACKDPRNTRMKIASPEWFTLRPWMREPQVVYGFEWRGELKYALTHGLITGHRKPGISTVRVKAHSWPGFSGEYRYLPKGHPHIAELKRLFGDVK